MGVCSFFRECSEVLIPVGFIALIHKLLDSLAESDSRPTSLAPALSITCMHRFPACSPPLPVRLAADSRHQRFQTRWFIHFGLQKPRSLKDLGFGRLPKAAYKTGQVVRALSVRPTFPHSARVRVADSDRDRHCSA